MFWGFDNKDLLRGTYVVTASLHNSSPLQKTFKSECLMQRLACADTMSPNDIEERRTTWAALDVDPEVLDLLSEEFQLVFCEGRLVVARKCQTRADLIGDLSACLLAIWRSVPFTDRRGMSVGSLPRAVVAAVLTGLVGFVASVTDQPSSSMFYLQWGSGASLATLRSS